jgi:hypothetical protein
VKQGLSIPHQLSRALSPLATSSSRLKCVLTLSFACGGAYLEVLCFNARLKLTAPEC